MTGNRRASDGARRICVVRQYYYPHDIRVRREVESLLDAGHSVDVVCLRRPGEPAREQHDRLAIWRLPMAHARGGVATYVVRYAMFLVLASVVVASLHVRRRYALVQVHSLPDTLVLVGAVPRLLGARVLLDLHEVMPEFFATKFARGLAHPLVRLVVRAEQLSIRVADHAMTCTDQMREAFVERGAPADKITVVLNSADERVFDVQRFPPAPDPSSFTLVCHGTIEERYGLDTVVRAVAMLRDDLPDVRLRIYGEGSFREALVRLVSDLGVADRVWVSDGLVPLDELLDALSHASAGVVAMKQDAFRDLTHCNKMYELMALRVPVVTSRTRSVAAYFSPDEVEYFTPGDPADLARALRALHADPRRRARLVDAAAAALDTYGWPRQEQTYREVVDHLLRSARRAAA